MYRSPAEKLADPERLNLDRRGLTGCPVLEGEERLRLLNYQVRVHPNPNPNPTLTQTLTLP